MDISRVELLEGLTALKSGLAGKEIVEQSACVVFMEGRAWTFNDELAMSVAVAEGLEGAVPADELLSLLSRMKDEVLHVECLDNELSVKGKRAKAGLRREAEVKLPIATISKVGRMRAMPDGVADAMKEAISYASRSLARAELTSVHVQSGFVEATDGFQMMRRQTGEGIAEFFIPARLTDAVLAISPEKCSIGMEWAHFEGAGGVRASVRLPECTYPDLTPFLEPAEDGEHVEFPADILEAVERAEVFAKREFEQDHQLSILFDAGVMVIRSENDKGWVEEKCRTKFKGTANFLIHPQLLRVMLDKSSAVVLCQDRMVVSTDAATYAASLMAADGKG